MSLQSQPLISCIMPTRRRRKYVRLAIKNFMEQSYPNKELLILGDDGDRLDDLIPEGAPIKLMYGPQRHVGEKRNKLIEASGGKLIAHWDDDDWRHPDWLRVQQEYLAGGGLIVGLPELIYYHPESKRGFIYRWNDARKWVAGGSMMYWRQVWEQVPFTSGPGGEDTTFIWDQRQRRIVYNPNTEMYVARIHTKNTNGTTRDIDNIRWEKYPSEKIEAILGGVWG